VQKKIIANFHVLGLFKPLNLGGKKSVCHAAVMARNLYRRYLSRQKCYRFEISATLHHTTEFSNLWSKKKIDIIFDIFAEMLDGSGLK
jgi:hypothetical protein